MHEAVGQCITKKNDFKKKIKALEKEVDELNKKNTELEGDNRCMYNSYEERISNMTNNMHEAVYTRDVQLDDLKKSSKEELSKVQEYLAANRLSSKQPSQEREDLECQLAQAEHGRTESEQMMKSVVELNEKELSHL